MIFWGFRLSFLSAAGNLLLVGDEARHCPDGSEGSRKPGLLAVLICGGEDAAVDS